MRYPAGGENRGSLVGGGRGESEKVEGSQCRGRSEREMA